MNATPTQTKPQGFYLFGTAFYRKAVKKLKFVSIREIEDAIIDHVEDVGIESVGKVEEELIVELAQVCKHDCKGDEIKIIDTNIVLGIIEEKIKKHGIFNLEQKEFSLMRKVLKAIRENLFSLDIGN